MNPSRYHKILTGDIRNEDHHYGSTMSSRASESAAFSCTTDTFTPKSDPSLLSSLRSKPRGNPIPQPLNPMKLKWKSSANSERLVKLYASLSYVQKQLTVVPSYQLHYKLIKNLDKPSTPNDERY